MYKFIKRILDFSLSFVALLILSPLIIPIALLLKFSGEGYVFYLQERIGYKNKPFNIIKFATMLKNSPNMEGGAITLKDDFRITRFGGILRKTKINEIPQILNILKGDMSFVGPRPVMKTQSFDHYPADVQKVIYNVQPGLTGLGSILFRDEESMISEHVAKGGDAMDFYTNTIYPKKGRIEKWYQANQSFVLDLKILFTTFWVVLFPKSKIAERWFRPLYNKLSLEDVESFSLDGKTLPTVSIITVTRNNADVLRTAIDSVCQQSYKQIEYILIDGASTDETMEIANSYGSKIHKCISEKDDGIYDGMNKGLKLATGDIVGFLNSDDYFASNDVVELIVKTMLSNEVEAVYGDLKYVDRENTSKVRRHWISNAYDRKKFIFGWMPPHPTFYAKRDNYLKFGNFDVNLRNSADYELMLRFLYKHELSAAYLSKVLVMMREGGASNQSLQARLNANKEDYKAWLLNGLKPKFYTRFFKPLRKISQFIKA